ncbi:MAG: dTDP-glucose 4,6-dehydratase [Euryarchaeota archaeon]|nr:dTDP-glucose 4,6-dehydratase [Euryarchaeota archaeon]|tara:strand:- start:14357 stop:15409 length:1053 start_codon:yes stop_codon:yes gene_type:complete
MQENQKYLITGGCGFIGSAVIRYLIKDQKNKVLNIDKLTYSSNPLAVEIDKSNNYSHKEIDISDTKSIKNIINSFEPDYIINLAAESHVDRSIDNPQEFIFSNIVGSYVMLNEGYLYWKELNGSKKETFRFLQISTDEIYGSTKDTFNEKSLINPNSPYAASKGSSDLLSRAWYKTYNFPVLITNCSNNYGKWQYPEKLIPLCIKKCLTQDSIPIYGSGNQERDWIHVDDHVKGMLLVLNQGSIGERYNIASGKSTKNIDIVNLICSYFDEHMPLDKGKYSDLIEYVDDRPGHDFRYSMDIGKIRSELSWEPTISFEDGIKKTIKWYLENKDWLMDPKIVSYKGERLGQI